MAKNVTGGIVLLLGGAAIISLAVTPKGQAILKILKDGATAATTDTAPATEPGTVTTPGGFQYNPNNPGGFGGSGRTSGAVTTPDYKTILGFVGEKGAAII